MTIDAPKNFFNLTLLDKLLQIIVKLKFRQLIHSETLIEPPVSVADNLTANLKAKIRLAFKDETELLRWINLGQSNMVKPEEFWFGF